MTHERLWDKGEPLDERVLRYTAGEDHALDERLVRLRRARLDRPRRDAARAEACSTAADFEAIRDGLDALGAAHARGEWQIELADEDGQTALERRLTAKIGAAGGRVHLGRSRNDQVLTALRLYLRDAVAELAAGADAVAAALDALGDARGRTSRCPATPTCSRRCRAPWRCGPAALPPNCATTPQGLAPARCGASTRTRWARPPATARRGCRSTARRPRAAARLRRVHEPVTAVQLSRGKAESAAAVRDHAADAGPRPARRRPAAVLHAGVRVREAAGGVHHRLLDHAAEAQPGRVRAGARRARPLRRRA